MPEYINKDYYKQLTPNDRSFINLTAQNIKAVMDRLEAEHIMFSATVGYKNTVTVSNADRDKVLDIVKNLPQQRRDNMKIIGNTAYKDLPPSERRYINTDAETAMQVANILAGDAKMKFSGRLNGNSATLTVVGDNNAAFVRRIIDNVQNMDLVNELREKGYERIADSNGFVNIRNMTTGDVAGFESLKSAREMFLDPDNEFFHPTAVRIEENSYFRIVSDEPNMDYFISEYDAETGDEVAVYLDDEGRCPTFATVVEALDYANAHGVSYTNTNDQLDRWKFDDEERVSEQQMYERNIDIQSQFPQLKYEYPDDISYNADNHLFHWVYFNEEGDGGDGEFNDVTITEDDVLSAYNSDNFLQYVYANCKQNVIDTHSGYFEDYANAYINKPANVSRFYDTGEFIRYMIDNTPEAFKQKNYDKEITADADELIIDGYEGTWYVVDTETIDGKEHFLLESENYGDETFGIIIDKDRNVLVEEAWNGFQDYHEKYDDLTLAEKFAAKVEKEYTDFITALKKESADVIIESAYEVSTKDNIRTYISEEELLLTESQLQTLINKENILDDLYGIWNKYENYNSYSDVASLLEDTANKISYEVQRLTDVVVKTDLERVFRSIRESSGNSDDISDSEAFKRDYRQRFLDTVYSGKYDVLKSYLFGDETVNPDNIMSSIRDLDVYNQMVSNCDQLYTAISEQSKQRESQLEAVFAAVRKEMETDDNNGIETDDFDRFVNSYKEHFGSIALNGDHPALADAVFGSDEQPWVHYENSVYHDRIVKDMNSLYDEKRTQYLESQKEAPLYLKSASYARDNGELDLYRASNKENHICSNVIDAYMSKHYRENVIHTEDALADIREKYSLERVALVVAININAHNYDGRITDVNKKWAADYLSDIPEDIRQRTGEFHLSTHPGLIDLFANTVRDSIEKEREVVPEKNVNNLEIGDKFRYKGNEVEVVSLTGVLPFYTDDCAIRRESSGIVITENVSKADLIANGEYIAPEAVNNDLETAKKYIADFHEKEYGEENETDFSDLSNIGLVYTTLGDEQEHEFQVTANLIDPSISYSIDGEVVRTDLYDSLADMIEKDLSFLDFDYFQTEGYKELEKKYPEKDEIAEALDLENNTITFSVVTIDDEQPFVVGDYVDKYSVTDLDEYQDYIFKTDAESTDVKVDYYQIGGGSESYSADDSEVTYISDHLDDIINHSETDLLESDTFGIETPEELIEKDDEEYDREELSQEIAVENADRIVWTPIMETADDNGNPTSYSTKYNDEFFWISENEFGNYDVEMQGADGKAAPINSDYIGFLSRADAEEYFADHIDEYLAVRDEQILDSIVAETTAPVHELTEAERNEISHRNTVFNNYLNNNPKAVFREIVSVAGLNPTEDISVEETKAKFADVMSIDITLSKNKYPIQLTPTDDGLNVFHPASGREATYVWGQVKELMYLIANENNLERDNIIRNEVMRGTGFEDGKFRVEDYYKTNPTSKEFANFLKKEFGIGGHSGDGPIGFTNHDGKGIEIEVKPTNTKELFTWAQVAKVVSDLIDKGDYITQNDISRRIRSAQWTINNANENTDFNRLIYAHKILQQYGLEKASGSNEFKIYQLKAGEENHDLRFETYARALRHGEPAKPENYDLVYTGNADDFSEENKLEAIYTKFNIDRPADFKGHSLSVSDIIVVDGKANYVDDTGFTDVSDKFLGRAKEKINFNDYEDIRIVNRSTWKDDVTVDPRDFPPYEKTTVSFSYDEERDISRYAYNSTNSTSIKVWDDESYVTAEEMIAELNTQLEKMRTQGGLDCYIELVDAEGNSTQLLSHEFEFVVEEAPVKEMSLAQKLDDFIYDYDTYGYMDNLEVGETREDAVAGIEADIENGNVTSYLPMLNDIISDGGEDNDFVERAKELVDAINALAVERSTYDPAIGDVVELDDTLYRISDITEGTVSLEETSSFFPEVRQMTVAEFLNAGISVYEKSQNEPVKLSEMENIKSAEDSSRSQVENEKKADNDRTENTETQSPVGTETKNNFVITNEDLGVNGPKARFNDNVAAVETLKLIESENRTATPEEQQILSGYTGWGAIPQAFDPNNEDWKNEYEKLRTVLTDSEYMDARHSTLNSHYTSPVVINAIYEGLANIGFEQGKVLEPAMGIGNFFGVMPESMRGSELHGVELDDLTGRIAKQLYPDADIQIKGFEKTSFKNNSFDVVVGNVPFGNYKVSDKDYNKNNFLIHDYFLAKSLDKVHPGGVVAVVTSSGTMDKKNSDIRKYLAQRAELLGAIRLPDTAFKANAGTEVVSDILFLKKRERAIEIDTAMEGWINIGTSADGFDVNNYFAEHPEMVMGQFKEVSGRFGNETTVQLDDPSMLKGMLSEAVKNIQGTYEAASIEAEAIQNNPNIVPAPADSRKFSYQVDNGELYFREDSDTMEKVQQKGKGKDKIDRVIAMVDLRETVRSLLDMQMNNSDKSLDDDIADTRAELNKKYDTFVEKFGFISDKKNKDAFKGDDDYQLLSALETEDKEKGTFIKADIFEHNTVKPKTIADHVDTAQEALILSVAEKAKIDFDYMSDLCGMDKDSMIAELQGQIFRLPVEEEKYVTADEYLTGNIRKKIADLDNAPEGMDITANREALMKAIPPRVEAKDISVKLGSHWISPDYIRDFILEKFNPNWDSRQSMTVQYSKAAGEWKIDDVKASSKKNYTATNVFGTQRMNAYKILEGILNNSDLQVKDRKKDENGNDMLDANGKYILVVNQEETKAVRQVANLIKSEFQDWIFKDPDRRENLVNTYNEIYNSIRQREYDGSHLNFVGMNTDITLKDHQKNAIARALYGGNTLLAHAVGAGKTFEMIAIAMEGKRLGLHNKSLFAVPNSLTEQIGSDFRRLYPNANILVATKKDFEKANRLKLFAKIASNDWDAVIVGHSQFDRMGLSPEREKGYLEAEIEKLRDAMESAAAYGEKSFSVKKIESAIASYQDKLSKLNDAQVKDDFIDFEKLGFDKLFVDECHMYKNLATPTKMHNVSGLGSGGSARSFNMLMKTKYMDELTGGKGVTFASGTPVSNSMCELYTMMRYLQADMLKDCNIDHFDEWAADFGEVKTDYELKPESDGKYQLKTRFAKFTNLPELMGMFKECADIRTADTLDLDKPVSHLHEVVAEPSKVQKRLIKSLSKRASKIREGNVDPREDNMLVITNDGRKIGLDQRLIDSSFPDEAGSKVNLCIDNVYEIYEKNKPNKGTQCIFCDMSTPKADSRQDRFEVYRPDATKELGYALARKKLGLGNGDEDNPRNINTFADVKSYIDKHSPEYDDKLHEGDIVVIRRPNLDDGKIYSQAAIFEDGKLNDLNSPDLLEKLAMSDIEDMPPKEFNVYDDIKNKLVAKGVPEDQIAFIHDYDTAEQKQKLFDQMNNGDVRILLGSTAKCGAGMNAQKKMVALHHLDCPLRPSDMEQRNGRIERQGNENPEVDIYRYVTNKSFDSYLFQILENKQKFISQVMTSKTPERTCADLDETALDYAEVKALCAGNPLIKKEMELQTLIKDLKMEKSRYSEHIYELQDNIRVKIPEKIHLNELVIEHLKKDVNTANKAHKCVDADGKEFYPITIMGKEYNDRKEAGTKLKDIIAANAGRIAEGKTLDIGEYRGFKLSVFFDTLTKHVKACLDGEKHHYCDLNTETDTGNLIRLDNLLNNVQKSIDDLMAKNDVMRSELEQMKADVDKPFSKEAELRNAEAEIEEVHLQLTQFEMTDDTLQKEAYESIADMFPGIMDKTDAYIKLVSDTMEDVHVEINDDVLTICQTYEQNGDLIYDPRIDLRVDRANQKVIPISFENSGGGAYQEFNPDELTADMAKEMNDVLEFLTETMLEGIVNGDFTEEHDVGDIVTHNNNRDNKLVL